MNKTEFVKKVAAENALTQKKAAEVVDSVLNAVVDAVAAGEKVSFPGFGTFESKARAARVGKNPQTGEAVEIAAATVPAFKAGKAFKDKVNK
ncbi:MAG: HU family DNA-binding protein [Oscillospiraceae bacterium]|nr:HU family DNA-binding protein [Oscillospiraceae bacterium]